MLPQSDEIFIKKNPFFRKSHDLQFPFLESHMTYNFLFRTFPSLTISFFRYTIATWVPCFPSKFPFWDILFICGSHICIKIPFSGLMWVQQLSTQSIKISFFSRSHDLKKSFVGPKSAYISHQIFLFWKVT